jgi:histone H2B
MAKAVAAVEEVKSEMIPTARKYHKKSKRTFNRYIHKVLKEITKDASFSSKGIKVVNSFVQDIFERIAVEAASLTRFNNTKTMTSREIQTAVRLILPASLANHAMEMGTKAVANMASK